MFSGRWSASIIIAHITIRTLVLSAYKILALGGDGIGPEVVEAALRALEVAAAAENLKVEVEEDLRAAWDAYGTFCRDETVDRARKADAVLVGAVGGPKWDEITVPGGPVNTSAHLARRVYRLKQS